MGQGTEVNCVGPDGRRAGSQTIRNTRPTTTSFPQPQSLWILDDLRIIARSRGVTADDTDLNVNRPIRASLKHSRVRLVPRVFRGPVLHNAPSPPPRESAGLGMALSLQARAARLTCCLSALRGPLSAECPRSVLPKRTIREHRTCRTDRSPQDNLAEALRGGGCPAKTNYNIAAREPGQPRDWRKTGESSIDS